MSVCARESRCPQRPEECIGCPCAGVTGSCEPPHLGVGNQMWVIFKVKLLSPEPFLQIRYLSFHSLRNDHFQNGSVVRTQWQLSKTTQWMHEAWSPRPSYASVRNGYHRRCGGQGRNHNFSHYNTLTVANQLCYQKCLHVFTDMSPNRCFPSRCLFFYAILHSQEDSTLRKRRRCGFFQTLLTLHRVLHHRCMVCMSVMGRVKTGVSHLLTTCTHGNPLPLMTHLKHLAKGQSVLLRYSHSNHHVAHS